MVSIDWQLHHKPRVFVYFLIRRFDKLSIKLADDFVTYFGPPVNQSDSFSFCLQLSSDSFSSQTGARVTWLCLIRFRFKMMSEGLPPISVNQDHVALFSCDNLSINQTVNEGDEINFGRGGYFPTILV